MPCSSKPTEGGSPHHQNSASDRCAEQLEVTNECASPLVWSMKLFPDNPLIQYWFNIIYTWLQFSVFHRLCNLQGNFRGSSTSCTAAPSPGQDHDKYCTWAWVGIPKSYRMPSGWYVCINRKNCTILSQGFTCQNEAGQDQGCPLWSSQLWPGWDVV